MQHSTIIISPLLVSRGNAPELFEPVNQPLNTVTQAITRFVKRATTLFIRAPRNRVPHTTLAQVSANSIGTVGLIAHQSFGPQFGTTWSRSIDGTLLHQRLERNGLMALTGGQDEGHRLPVPLTAHVYLGGKATTGVA